VLVRADEWSAAGIDVLGRRPQRPHPSRTIAGRSTRTHPAPITGRSARTIAGRSARTHRRVQGPHAGRTSTAMLLGPHAVPADLERARAAPVIQDTSTVSTCSAHSHAGTFGLSSAEAACLQAAQSRGHAQLQQRGSRCRPHLPARDDRLHRARADRCRDPEIHAGRRSAT
jgi:hypothetical protein